MIRRSGAGDDGGAETVGRRNAAVAARLGDLDAGVQHGYGSWAARHCRRGCGCVFRSNGATIYEGPPRDRKGNGEEVLNPHIFY